MTWFALNARRHRLVFVDTVGFYGLPTSHEPYARRRVSGFFTSDACLAACRRFLGPEVLAAELCRLWFDDIYVPGERYLDGLKGDRNEAAIERFEACFTVEELVTLERFHGCLELRLDLAANRLHGRAFFPENDSWRSIRRDAAHLLNDLAPDPDYLRNALAGLVAALLQQHDHTIDTGTVHALIEDVRET